MSRLSSGSPSTFVMWPWVARAAPHCTWDKDQDQDLAILSALLVMTWWGRRPFAAKEEAQWTSAGEGMY